jgi:hypothetical protein
MFKKGLLNGLKNKESINSNDDKKKSLAVNKVKKQKRLSSQEFQSTYDSLWKEGPSVNYQNPDARLRYLRAKGN